MEISGKILKDALKRKGITTTLAAITLGVSRQTLSTWLGKAALDPDTILQIQSKLGIDLKNLPHTLVEQQKPVIEAKPLRLADPYGFEATGLKFYTLADGSEMMQVPVIPVTAYGGYLRGHADPEWYDAMNFDTMTFPVDKQHRGVYMAFEMKGDSMVNITTEAYARKSLWPNQRIIGRDLKKEHWKHKLHMHNNEAWIIVHRERGIVVKDITEHDTDTGRIRCHSWNPNKEEHPDFDIYLEDVEQLMNVVDPYGKMKPY